MHSILLSLLNFVSKPFAGKGIDKKFPILVTLYQKFYTSFQKNELVTIAIPNNAQLTFAATDPHIGMFLIYKKEYEPLETALYSDSLTKDSVIFDVGANVGYYTVIGAKTAAKVYAFEPDRGNYQLLLNNISLNKLTTVQAENLAVGEQAGSLPFHMDKVHRGKSGIAFDGTSFDYMIPVITLDQYCAQNSISHIDIIKLDVEGSEISVLKGGANIIRNSPNLKLFIEFNPDSLRDVHLTQTDFFAVLAMVNLKPVKIIDETRKTIIDFSPQNVEEVLKHATFTNLYCEKSK